MYTLPIPNADGLGIPLHEHTAFVVVTGLLHDDLDDRHDSLRSAFEIDPLLALWAVLNADHHHVQLKSLQSATRWLAANFLQATDDPDQLLSARPLGAPQRAAWRKISVAAISAGRIAQRNASAQPGARPHDAFWLAMLASTRKQLDALAQLNGHSPLHGVAFGWPKWLRDIQLDSFIQNAIANESTDAVSEEESALWFRPYPEFRQLAPLMMQKLTRLAALEERFEETLQTEKLAAMQQLAYGASHEINNPLANISTRAQTLVYNEMDDDRRKKLLAINDQAFRAYEMIADLMLFAKPPRLEPQDVVLDGLLHTVRDELTESAANHGVQVNLHLDEQPIRCLADPAQLSVAIKAICINGLEAMQPGGTLTVETRLNKRAQIVEIAVEDTGSGLSESARRHLFDPFFSGGKLDADWDLGSARRGVS